MLLAIVIYWQDYVQFIDKNIDLIGQPCKHDEPATAHHPESNFGHALRQVMDI